MQGEFQNLIGALQPGDCIVALELDRFGRIILWFTSIHQEQQNFLQVFITSKNSNVTTRKIISFESLATFTADREQRYGQLEETHLSKWKKLNRLKELSKMYALYAPIQDIYKESQSLRGLAKRKYDKD